VPLKQSMYGHHKYRLATADSLAASRRRRLATQLPGVAILLRVQMQADVDRVE
jgi:hypothetical protein